MLKEINEQPAVMRRIIQEYEDENGDLNIDSEIIKDVSNAIAFILLLQEQVIMLV